MKAIDRRSFLGAAFGTAAVAAWPEFAEASQKSKNPWKNAFMLGGLSKGSPLPTFQLLKDAGFEGVELISPNDLDLQDVLSAARQDGPRDPRRQRLAALARPPSPTLIRPWLRGGMAAIRQEFADCKAYGGTTVLVVPAVVNRKVGYRDAYKRSQENIRKLIPDAEAHGIKIAIEEVWNKFLLSPVEFSRYIDEFESPWVRAYFDVGNVVEFAYPEEWIRELGKRILKVHIKEYAKEKRFQYRLGEGREIDWSAVCGALKDVGYQGWISAEVPLGDLEAMKDVEHRMDQLLELG